MAFRRRKQLIFDFTSEAETTLNMNIGEELKNAHISMYATGCVVDTVLQELTWSTASALKLQTNISAIGRDQIWSYHPSVRTLLPTETSHGSGECMLIMSPVDSQANHSNGGVNMEESMVQLKSEKTYIGYVESVPSTFQMVCKSLLGVEGNMQTSPSIVDFQTLIRQLIVVVEVEYAQ